MRVTIIAPPAGALDEVRISDLKVGRTYNLSAALAATLIVGGYAQAEMRSAERRKHARENSADKRRRKPPK